MAMKKLYLNPRGQALAETALVVPLLLLLMLGLINLGLVAFAANHAKNAAQYGARLGSVAQADPGGVATQAASQQVATAPIGEYAISLLASGGQRGDPLLVRVHWRVPNYLSGLLGLFGANSATHWEGDADAVFRQEGW